MGGFTLLDGSGNVILEGNEVVNNPTLYVDATNGNDSNTGSSAGAGNALATLQAAADKLNAAQIKGVATINIAAGTYYACTLNLDNVSAEQIKVLGAGSGTTILSGAAGSGSATTAAQDHVVNVTDCRFNELKIKDVKIQYCLEANVFLQNVTGKVSLEDCHITNCESSATTAFQITNGCVVADNVQNLEIDGCTIENSQSHCVNANRTYVDMVNTASTFQFPSKDADLKGHCICLQRESTLEIRITGCLFKGNGVSGAGYDAYGIWAILFSKVNLWLGAGGLTLQNLKEGRRSQHATQVLLANASTITYTDCETNITELTGSETI